MSGIKSLSRMSTSASDGKRRSFLAVSPAVSDRSRPALIHQSALPSPDSLPRGLGCHHAHSECDRKWERAGRRAHEVCFLGCFTGRHMMFRTHLLCLAAGGVWVDFKFAGFVGLLSKSTVWILVIWKDNKHLLGMQSSSPSPPCPYTHLYSLFS